MDASAARTTKGQDYNGVKATARKLRKRELDRKAQRVARERTKNRIQELESLVEELKADTFNPELSNLMTTLTQVKHQRDELQVVVRSIDQTIQRHIREGASSSSSSFTPHSEPRRHLDRITQSCHIDDTDPSLAAPSHPEDITEGSNANVAADRSQSIDDFWDMLPSEACIDQPVETPLTADNWGQPVRPLPEEHLRTCIPAEDIIIPHPQWPCDCVQTESANIWRNVNTSLGRSTALSPAQLAIEDFTSEDTPVRVVCEGWDNVAKAGKMSLSWRKLREIDQTCFSTCGDVERLGILRIMHLLLTCHGDPSRERREKVPRWLWARPSQTIPHSYAIDFFVWPGLRERFIFTQHRYCTNLFWQLFRGCITLCWPFDFADCYAVDPDTGRYVLSPAFDHRLRDINTWRMTGDFFAQFPELYEDIPASGSIAPSIGSTKEEMALYKLQAEQPRETGDTSSQAGPHSGMDLVVPSTHGSSNASVGLQNSQIYQGIPDSGRYSLPAGLELECPWPSV